MKPQPVSDPQLAFPAGIMELLPPYADIPDDFKNDRTPWNKIISRWFYSGLPKGTEFVPKPSIDKTTALRHLKAVMGSWEPKHEHKTAGCAYLLSLWFEEVKIPDKESK